MKSIRLIDELDKFSRDHGKVVFTVTELANITRTTRASVNVHLNRLIRAGFLIRYGHGLYGRANVSALELLPFLDPLSYMTGLSALFRHGLVTQSPVIFTCFSARQHGRNRILSTPAGVFEFSKPSQRIFAFPATGVTAPPEQALCDFVYLSVRRKTDPNSMVTFRNLSTLSSELLRELLSRYPGTVGAWFRRQAILA